MPMNLKTTQGTLANYYTSPPPPPPPTQSPTQSQPNPPPPTHRRTHRTTPRHDEAPYSRELTDQPVLHKQIQRLRISDFQWDFTWRNRKRLRLCCRTVCVIDRTPREDARSIEAPSMQYRPHTQQTTGAPVNFINYSAESSAGANPSFRLC